MLDIDEIVGEPDRVRALSGRIPASPTPIFFVPSIEVKETAIGKKAGAESGTYASPIETRGDGLPANAPPWPVSVDGPKLVPVNADPTFSAAVDWSANGNFSVAARVISQIGETIHYRWERYDITKYARQQLAADPAGAAVKPPGAEKTLDQRIAEFTAAKAGAGTDVTGTGGCPARVRPGVRRLVEGHAARRQGHPRPARRHGHQLSGCPAPRRTASRWS